MKTFTFYSDPSHAWLKVTRRDCLDLGFVASDFSSYSYRGNDGATIYLEEDCDASKFLRAFEAKFGKPVIRESHCKSTSSIRRLPRNGSI